MGPVEIEVDPSSLTFEFVGEPYPCDLIVNGGVALLGVQYDRSRDGGIAVLAGDKIAAISGHSAKAGRWRLVQRDYDGRPISVFEYDASTGTSS